jgi:hypothetical protein
MVFLIVLTACYDKAVPSFTETGRDSDSNLYEEHYDTEPCGTYTGETFVGVDLSLCSQPDASTALQTDCDGAQWWLDVYTVGWAASVDWEFNQYGTSFDWLESHPVPSHDSDSDGWWDNHYVDLDIVESVGEVVEGQTSLFQCNAERKATLYGVLLVYDADNTELDCVYWGVEGGAEAWLDGHACTPWE